LATVVGAGAVSFQRNTQWRDPAVLWSQALQENPDNPSVLHELGRIHLRRGEGALDTAVVVSQQGSSGVANQAMEDAQESFVEAESWFAKVVASDPENASAAYYHGLSLFYVERYDDALVALLTSLRLDPWQQEAALRVAMLLQADADEMDDRDLRMRAVDYYALAERMGPLPAEIAPRYATALTALGDLEESARVWESAGSGVNIGERESIRAAVASQQRLITAAQKGLAVDPFHTQALGALGKAHFDAGRYLKASYILEDSLAQDGTNLQAWMILGIAKATMGTPQTFAAEWPAPPSPSLGSGWAELARACAAASMWDEALVYLESPAAKADNIKRPLVRLVDVAWEQGSREKLEELLNRATSAYPDDATPWLRLFDLSMSRSNGEGAAAYLDRAEALGAAPRDITSRRGRLR
jgi:tetratricopeptide (TPR) repeat protein